MAGVNYDIKSLGIGSQTPDDGSNQRGRAGGAFRALRRSIVNYLPAILLISALIVFWELFNKIFDQPDYILPPLHDIIYTAFEHATSHFLPNAWVTLQEVLIGYFVAVICGLLIGVGISESVTLKRALLPLVISTQAIPILAIAPVLIIWFGFVMTPKVIIVVLISFFPIVITTVTGLQSVSKDMLYLLDSLSASRWQVLHRVKFPAALPYIFAGLKNAAVISVIGAFVGEYVGAIEGLAPVMILANSAFQTDVVFAAILYLSLMGILMYLTVALIERRMIRWHFIARGDNGQGS